MYANDELIKLTELLRIGLATVREIASRRGQDYSALMDIAKRSEAIAAELDLITGRRKTPSKVQ